MLINLQKFKDDGTDFTLINLQKRSNMKDHILRLSICKKIKDNGPDFTPINLQKIKDDAADFTLINVQKNQRWGTRFKEYQFAEKSKYGNHI